MKIALIGGHDEADFLIDSLLKKKHRLAVVNVDHAYCEYLAGKYQIPIAQGDPCKFYVLDEAHVDGCDVLIALTPNDADNLAICQAGKCVYGVKKVVCTVKNPKNVEVFKKLGVNTVISASYMVARTIEQASTIESLIRTLSLDEENVVLTEITVACSHQAAGRRVAELGLPAHVIISCILRGQEMLVPNGDSVIQAGDKLLILSQASRQDEIVEALTLERKAWAV